MFFSHTYSSLHSSIRVQDKKIMTILFYFKFTGALVFTICRIVILNIGDSSIRCVEKNTDVHQ